MAQKRRTPAWTKFTEEERAALPRCFADTRVYGYYFGTTCKHGHNDIRQRTYSGSQCMPCRALTKENERATAANPKKVKPPKPEIKTFKVFGMNMPVSPSHKSNND